MSPISARLTRRSGGNDTSQSVGRAVNSAARSADSTAHVFGTASVEHEEDDDVEDEADGDALGAEQLVGQQRGEERLAHLQDGDGDEQRVDEPLRMGRRAAAAPAPTWCLGESAIAWALTREMRLSAVSATARNASTNRMTTIASSIQISVRSSSSVLLLAEAGRRRTAPVVGVEQLELPRPHRRRLVGLGVVVAEDVEHAVDDEQGQLVVERAGVRRRLVAGDGRADDDVAEQHRHGPSAARVRSAGVERERQHVGRPVLAEVLAR